MQVRSEDQVPYNAKVQLTDSEELIIARAWAIIQRRASNARKFTGPEQVKEYLTFANATQNDQHRERFAVLFLNSQHALIDYRVLFEGTLTATSVYPREIVRAALELNAAAIIITHNHPSGSTDFSVADQQMTRNVKAACATVDINVLDHILTTPSGATASMAERGLM